MSGGLDFASATILLVGAGRMGGAMLAGWVEDEALARRITVLDPHAPDEMREGWADCGVSVANGVGDAGTPDIVILAVKPQVVGDVLPTLAPAIGEETVLVSVAAGIPIERLQAVCPRSIRAMPNTPALVGRGITVCCAGQGVGDDARHVIDALMRTVGEIEWIEDEALMDAVTAVSGSGPAYVFALAETLAEAGRAVGLPDETAMRLANATVAGAGELLHRSDLQPSALRENVTSPGGTTAAALDVLLAVDGLPTLMKKAVERAAERSRELSSA